MKQIGGALFFFGVGSIVLNLLHREFAILLWIDHWGSAVGWGIRIALAVVGGALWLFAPKPAAESA